MSEGRIAIVTGSSRGIGRAIALAIVGVWIVIGAAWLVYNSATTKKGILVQPAVTLSPER